MRFLLLRTTTGWGRIIGFGGTDELAWDGGADTTLLSGFESCEDSPL